MRLVSPGNTGIVIAVLISLCCLLLPVKSAGQVKENNPLLKWSSWALLQAIPSVTFFEDRNENSSSVKFGLEWQVIPLSYSFHTNKYISNISAFYINPVKRFTGSAEIFFEPAIVTRSFKYADMKKFSYKTGARIVIPVAQRGEYLAFSIGAGYYSQKTLANSLVDGITYEAGVYSFFGMLGLKFNFNQKGISRYNISLYIKYY